MKKIILFAAAAFMSFSSFAQDYAAILQKTFVAFDTSWNQPDKQLEYSNKLSLIAKKYDKEWTAAYYAAWSKVQISWAEKDGAKKEGLMDEAQMLLDQAVSLLGKENDETYVVRAMIASVRMSVDPQNRWQTYGKQFTENLDKAKELNPNNPRIYLQLGINKFFTPEMWGGGKKAALPYFEKAADLFAKRTDTDVLKPYWGGKANNYFMGLANGTIPEEKKG